MKIKTLNIKNTEYDYDKLEKLEHLYEGEKITQYLVKDTQESYFTKDLKKQIAESAYDNFFAQIINYYAGSIFSSKFKFELKNSKILPKEYNEFITSVNDKKTDMSEFLKQCTIDALVYGKSYCIIQLPSEEIPEEMTIGDLDDIDFGIELNRIEPEHVYSWRFEDNNLQWLVTHTDLDFRNSPYDENIWTKHTWTIYTLDQILKFETIVECGKNPDPELDITPTEIINHNLGAVPIIILDFPEGLHLGNLLAPTQIRYYNTNTAYSWAISRTCYSIPVIKTENPENAQALFKGNPRSAIILDQNASWEWTTPPGESLSEMASAISEAKKTIYSVANVSNILDEKSYNNVKSGIAKSQDQSVSDKMISSYKQLIKEFAQDILEMVSIIRGNKLEFVAIQPPLFDIDELISVLNDFPEIQKTEILERIAQMLGLENQKIKLEQPKIPELNQTVEEIPVENNSK